MIHFEGAKMSTVTMREVAVLSDASNHWIIQTPGRKYPAAVIQGDSLRRLQGLARTMVELTHGDGREELSDTAEELETLLTAYVEHYDAVLSAAGFRPDP